jgi:N4-gp56 family major capsid protein
MAKTNFATLTDEQKTAWGMDFWAHARNRSFINKFLGKSANSMVHHITELRKDKKGARAVMTLVADLTGDGVVGDNKLEDNEEAMKSFDTVIQIDQLRNANRIEGRMADQKSIVNFRQQSRDKLGYWLGDRIDQLAFLSLSSLPYTMMTNGATRVGSSLPNLEFAEATPAPTANRQFYLGADGNLVQGTGFDAPDGSLTPLTYRSLVRMKANAKDSYLKPLRSGGGEDLYMVFVTPQGMADLRLDPDFIQNVRNAGVRGKSNELFSGASSVLVDGMIIHEYRHVFSNEKAVTGDRFGATTGADIGQRVLFCGAQALGMADIGAAEWVEDVFDYENELGISIAKIFGFLNPQFKGNLASFDTKENFGVMVMDTALSIYA